MCKRPCVRRYRELVQYFIRRRRNQRLVENGDAPQHLHEDVEHRVPPRSVGLVEHPGRLHVDVLVGVADRGSQERRVAVDGLFVDGGGGPWGERRRRGQEVLVGGCVGADLGGHGPVAVFVGQGDDPLQQVSERIGQLRVDPADHGIVRKVSVGAEGHLGHEKETRRVHSVGVHQIHGIDDVPQRFGDFLPLLRPPAVRKQSLRKRQVRGHEKGGPVDRVKAQDILPHDMERRGPVLRKVAPLAVIGVPQRRHVIGQGIDPDVHDMIVVVGYRHAPLETRAADGEIPQTVLHKVQHLVSARRRGNEIGMVLVIRQQFILILAEPKKIRRFLGHPRHLGPGRSFAVDQLRFVVITLVPHGVPPLVRPQIYRPPVRQRLPKMLHGLLVRGVGGPHEVIVRNIHQTQQAPEGGADLVAKLLGGQAPVRRGLFDLLPVFVRAGEEEDLPPGQPHVAREDVAGERGVGVSDVRFVVHVVDGGRDLERAGVGRVGGGRRGGAADGGGQAAPKGGAAGRVAAETVGDATGGKG
mmetsp:Transcript_31235/g.61841  ORF Transcript_31235/g.61841 Transcript_31235/m.61841 type:complete len:526 (-) Transcript_31235:167-1744(-)